MFVFLLLLVADLTHAATENRNELFNLDVQQETDLNQEFNGNQHSSGLAVAEFEEDEQETQVLGFSSVNTEKGSSQGDWGQLINGWNHPAYPLPQAWLRRVSGSSPPA